MMDSELQRTAPRTLRVIKAVSVNESPESKQLRRVRALVIGYAEDYPQDFLKIAHEKVLDKQKK